MIGPTKKPMPDKLICTGCDVLITKELGESRIFPKKWVVNYCNHKKLDTASTDFSTVAFIKRGIPYTPEWCPAQMKEK